MYDTYIYAERVISEPELSRTFAHATHSAPGSITVVDSSELDGEQQPQRDPAGPLLSTGEVADRLGISRRQLNAMAQKLGVGRIIGSQRVHQSRNRSRAAPADARPSAHDCMTRKHRSLRR
jgi:hypothetical protein